MKNLKLIRATADDAEIIWNMQKTAFSEMLEKYKDYETSPAKEPLDKTVKRLNSPSTYFYFICVNEEYIGAIRIIDKKREGENKRISPVFIMPEHRNKGYAQAAIKAVENIHGAGGWELETVLQEAASCRLYEKTDFRRTDKIKIVNDKMSLIYYVK